LRPAWIDLGGIAKGYAVDAAVEVLLSHSVHSGVVNAGGDLRVFGASERTLHLRHPVRPNSQITIAKLRELSCASSGDYFVTSLKTKSQSALVTTARSGIVPHVSVSVITARCVIADALTKVVWFAGINAPVSCTLLRSFDAHAVVLNQQGTPHYV
jgi:FAD:protein FMN transferase